MRVIFNRSELLSALNLAGAVIRTNSPKPLLACVKLSASDRVSVYSTDLEMSLLSNLAIVQIERQGETALSSDDLRKIVAASEGDTVQIDVAEDGTATICADNSKFKLYGLAAKDYPPFPDIEGTPTFVAPCVDVAVALDRTEFAISKTDSSRYAFSGELIEVRDGSVHFVATDSKRLAMSGISVKTNGKFNAIVPERAISVIQKLLVDADEKTDIAFHMSDRRVSVVVGSASFTTALIEGVFPDWRDILPTDLPHKVFVDTATFVSAVRRAALLTSEESKGVVMDFKSTGVALSARASERGLSDVNYACRLDGMPIKIGMNPKFTCEAAKAVGGDGALTLEMAAPNRPMVFRGESRDAWCVVMPVNLL